MTQTVIVHLLNEDPMLAEMERMPEPADTTITLFYPRRIDGKPVRYLNDDVTSVIFPMHRISSIEIMAADRAEQEEIRVYRE